MTPRLEIWGVEGIPEVAAGDDLAALIVGAAELHDGDVLVVTSKVVSKAEGRVVAGSRDEHLAGETVRVVASRGPMHIVETHHGFVMAAAGIDESNVAAGVAALLPADPDASARRIRTGVRERSGADVAVIVSDTAGRPWRNGVTDLAIGAAGLEVVNDLRGQRDDAGHLLMATVVAVADEVAAAADLVKGKLTHCPVAVVRGLPFAHTDEPTGARALVRPPADDLFRLGTQEAMQQVVADSAPLSDITGGPEPDPAAVQRAIAAVAAAEVTVEAAGRTVSVAGEPLAAGIAVGRLLAALAAEGLRAAVASPPDGVTAALRVGVPPLLETADVTDRHPRAELRLADS